MMKSVLGVSLIALLFFQGAFAGHFGNTTETWVTDGYWYPGLEQEVEQAWLELLNEPEPFYASVNCIWIDVDPDFPGAYLDCSERVGLNGQTYNGGIIFTDKFRCPDEMSPVENVNRYCPGIPMTSKNNGQCRSYPSPYKKNPVHIATGNKLQVEVDLMGAGATPLRYRRYYNSMAQGTDIKVVGVNWFADYWQRLFYYDNLGYGMVELYQADGRRLTFSYTNGQWQSDADVVAALDELKDGQGTTTGWRLTLDNDVVEEYDHLGHIAVLRSVTDRNGRITTVINNLSAADGGDDRDTTLDKVIDPDGRELRFTYDANGDQEKMIDPAGQEYRYTHDAQRNLTMVTYPDNTPGDDTDNPKRIYHYEDLNFPNHLTGITDETGQRVATYAYDLQGRAILTEHAGGVERADIVYNADGTTTLTDSLGHVLTYHFSTQHGVVKISQVDGGPCESCGDSVQQVSYDANGFISSKQDFNGNLTTYVHNSRGLETSRIEGAGTTAERTILTDWHADFRVPIKITEPGRITEFSYDAQGRLLSRKVSAP